MSTYQPLPEEGYPACVICGLGVMFHEKVGHQRWAPRAADERDKVLGQFVCGPCQNRGWATNQLIRCRVCGEVWRGNTPIPRDGQKIDWNTLCDGCASRRCEVCGRVDATVEDRGCGMRLLACADCAEEHGLKKS